MRKTVNFLVGLAILLLVAGGIVFIVVQAFILFFGLNKDAQTATASVIGVLSVPVITYLTTRSLDGRRSRENSMRDRKTKFYDEMISDLISMFPLGTNKKQKSPDELTALFAKIPAPMLTFGSRGVIRAWNNFRAVSQRSPGDTNAMILAFEGLLKAMRQDLGHSTLSHQAGELVGVFVNDAQETLRKKS